MIALYILLGIVLLLIAVLSIKVRVSASYAEKFFVHVHWLFLKYQLYPLPPKKEKPQEEKPAEAPQEEKPQAEKKPNIFKQFYENQGFDGTVQLIEKAADETGTLLRSVKKHLWIDELFIWMTVSKDQDAAATAIAYGELCEKVFPALGFICSNLHVGKYDFEIEPDFLGSSNTASFETMISVRPIFLIGAAVSFAIGVLFRVVLKFFKAIRNQNKITKNQEGGVSQ